MFEPMLRQRRHSSNMIMISKRCLTLHLVIFKRTSRLCDIPVVVKPEKPEIVYVLLRLSLFETSAAAYLLVSCWSVCDASSSVTAMPARGQHNTYSQWFSWLGWLSYSFQRVSLAGVYTRLLFLSGVSFINVLIGAGLYRVVSGQTWGTSLYKAYGVLFRAPGIGVFSEETAAAAVVLNILFLFSLFVFAFLIGMISDEFKQQVCAILPHGRQLPTPCACFSHANWPQWSAMLGQCQLTVLETIDAPCTTGAATTVCLTVVGRRSRMLALLRNPRLHTW